MTDTLVDLEALGAELGAQLGDADALTCVACGAHFTHAGGRGRRPTRCPDCRSKRKRAAPSSSTGTRATGTEETAPKRPRGIDQLQASLHTSLAAIGVGVAFFDTFDSKVILMKAERGAKVLANLAQTNPTIRRSLEKGVELAGWGPVLMWGFELALPILAHHGVIRGVPDPALADSNGAI